MAFLRIYHKKKSKYYKSVVSVKEVFTMARSCKQIRRVMYQSGHTLEQSPPQESNSGKLEWGKVLGSEMVQGLVTAGSVSPGDTSPAGEGQE